MSRAVATPCFVLPDWLTFCDAESCSIVPSTRVTKTSLARWHYRPESFCAPGIFFAFLAYICRKNNLRTPSGKFLRVKFCQPESFDFLCLCLWHSKAILTPELIVISTTIIATTAKYVNQEHRKLTVSSPPSL